MRKNKILVDGSNVAFFKRNEKREAKIENLEILLEYLNALNIKYKIQYQIFTDASLKHRIDEKSKLENLYKKGTILQCPSGVRADDFLIEYAKRHPDETIIISNDCFRDYQITNVKLIKFVIVFSEFISKPDILSILEISPNSFKEENRIAESV